MKQAFIVALCLLSLSAIASAEVKQLPVNKLFQQALAADIAGNEQLRASLLADVIVQDPDHKLARWQSGQVLHNGRWSSLKKIEAEVASDPRWREYRDRVAAGEDTLAAHAELARWCQKQGLDLEARWHWFNVLRHESKNREALGALGLKMYQGEYLAPDEIAAREAAAQQAKLDFRRYTKLVKAALREAEEQSDNENITALSQIANLRDVAAVTAISEALFADPAYEKRILARQGQDKGEKFLRQVQRAGIAAFSAMPEHDATLKLMEISIFASDEQIRHDAAEALKYRELTDFVPLLMAGLAMPIEYSAQMNVSGNGLILVTEDYSETGPLAKATQAQTSTYDSKIVRWRGRREMAKMASVGQKALPFEVTKPNLQRDYMQAVQKVTTATQQIEIENQLREQRNARIEEVLTTVTGQQFSDGPKKWWTAWMQFNDVYSPETLPEYRREIEQDYSRYLEFRTMSCFVAGTPVWTQAGPVAIEKIKIGDLVLSQDPHTGEISYRPVIDRTVRPPCGTVKMVVNDETIVATRGHRFWISGQGWEMAKFLKAGLPIVAIGGSLKLESANPDQEAEAYNLEVGEFHTYFVGKNRILAHDNTCPQPTTNVLPGVSPRAEFAPQLALKN